VGVIHVGSKRVTDASGEMLVVRALRNICICLTVISACVLIFSGLKHERAAHGERDFHGITFLCFAILLPLSVYGVWITSITTHAKNDRFMRLLSMAIGAVNLVLYFYGMLWIVATSAPECLDTSLATIFFIIIAQQFVIRHRRTCRNQSSRLPESIDRGHGGRQARTEGAIDLGPKRVIDANGDMLAVRGLRNLCMCLTVISACVFILRGLDHDRAGHGKKDFHQLPFDVFAVVLPLSVYGVWITSLTTNAKNQRFMRRLSLGIGSFNVALYVPGMVLLTWISTPECTALSVVTIFFIIIVQQFVLRHQRGRANQSSASIVRRGRQAG
jgi:uncharacterized membrane protein YsdA (DUF1294 family)